VRKADNLPPSCAVVTKSGNLNFLEHSGPVQACNGTALPFMLRPYYAKLKNDGESMKDVGLCYTLCHKPKPRKRPVLEIFFGMVMSQDMIIKM